MVDASKMVIGLARKEFEKGKYYALVTSDIKRALYTTKRNHTIVALIAALNIILGYFRQRKCNESNEGSKTYNITPSVWQGTVISLLLCKMYN